MKKKFLTCILIALPFFCQATLLDEKVIENECEITPQVWQLITWPKIYKNNNLRRIIGQSKVAFGQKVIIEGKLTDSKCVPIVGAIVSIWHANAYGNLLNDKYSAEYKYDPNFINTGSAISDNLGNFHFITVFPGITKGRAPFVNLKVKHQDFQPMETVMYFENQTANDFDPVLKNDVDKDKQRLLIATLQHHFNEKDKEEAVYNFNITLEGSNKYLKY